MYTGKVWIDSLSCAAGNADCSRCDLLASELMLMFSGIPEVPTTADCHFSEMLCTIIKLRLVMPKAMRPCTPPLIWPRPPKFYFYHSPYPAPQLKRAALLSSCPPCPHSEGPFPDLPSGNGLFLTSEGLQAQLQGPPWCLPCLLVSCAVPLALLGPHPLLLSVVDSDVSCPSPQLDCKSPGG